MRLWNLEDCLNYRKIHGLTQGAMISFLSMLLTESEDVNPPVPSGVRPYTLFLLLLFDGDGDDVVVELALSASPLPLLLPLFKAASSLLFLTLPTGARCLSSLLLLVTSIPSVTLLLSSTNS